MDKFRGYEVLNKAMVLPALVDIKRHYGEKFWDASRQLKTDENTSPVLMGSIDWLITQGLITKENDLISLNDNCVSLLNDISDIENVVSHFGAFAHFVEDNINPENQKSTPLDTLFTADLPDPKKNIHLRDAIIPAAITLFYERAHRGRKTKMRRSLLSGDSVDLAEEFDGTPSPTIIEFMVDALIDLDLATLEDERHLSLTEKGKTALKLGGYAELVLSYYEVFAHLPELSNREITYGLYGDINRASELNARASNGILEIRVAPKILSLLNEDEYLAESLQNHGGIVLDFGSGGGVLTQRLLDCPYVNKAYGLDINKDAVAEARLLAKTNKKSEDEIEFMVGSLMDKDFFTSFKNSLAPGDLPVCTINFILHDVGKIHACTFLTNYQEVFGKTPILITESFRVPDKAMIDHPHHQNPSFKFMHDISGQYLFYKEEFEDLVTGEGFKIMSEHPHSSMTWDKENKRFFTIVTYVLVPE